MGGRGCFSDGGGFSLKGGHPMGGIGFDRGVSKKIVGWGRGCLPCPLYYWKPCIKHIQRKLYFLTDYSYILKNHFYFVNPSDYCFKPSLSRIFCVNSSVKVLSPQQEGPSTHVLRTLSLYKFIIYRKEEIGFPAKFFPKKFLVQRQSPVICLYKFPDPGIKSN